MLVTAAALSIRQEYNSIFTKGRYIPLEAKGPAETNVIAFAREYDDKWSITVVPRLVASLLALDEEKVQKKVGIVEAIASDKRWSETTLALPAELLNRQFANALTLDEFVNEDGLLKLSTVFAKLPVGILRTVD